MQPQTMAPAPAIQPAPVAAPIAPLAGPVPDRTMMIHTGLIVGALVLALLGVMGDAWSVEETSTTEEVPFVGSVTATFDNATGLNDFSISACSDILGGQTCVTEMDVYGTPDLSDAYDNCTAQGKANGANESQIEETCGSLGDMASAGFTGMLIISLGILVLITTLVATFLGTRGTTLPFSQFYPFGGAALTLIGVVVWYLMMPEPPEGSDPSLGSNAWMTIASSLFAAGAGGFTMYMGSPATVVTGGTNQSPSTSMRTPGLGARTLTEDSDSREFVLRETASGDRTLSIVEDGQLFRLTRATRGDNGTHCEDLFMTRMDALCGFTHSRFDWLDSTRYLWNFMALAGLFFTIIAFENTSLIFYTNWFILFFAIGTILSMMQWADPELITFETNTGKHRLLIYRAGSNRVLTNTSMDLIDSMMRDALRGEEIDPSALNAVADSIEAEMAEARKAAEEAAALQQAALLQAQAMAQVQAEMQAQMQAQALAQAQVQIQAQQAAAPPAAMATTPAAPPPVATPPPQMATPPPVTASPPPMAAPAPAPVPPVMNPPPAPAPMAAPPPVATPPPPAPLPPPGGLAAPLPPPMASPDMGILTETITPAPEIPMQAAPRDDSLSEGEKENILSELGED